MCWDPTVHHTSTAQGGGVIALVRDGDAGGCREESRHHCYSLSCDNNSCINNVFVMGEE